jgi:hypothetical protein
MKKQIVVIATTIMNKAHFIKCETQVANGEFHPEFTTDVNQAKDYEDPAEARVKLRKIRNSFNRVFSVMNELVDFTKRASLVTEEDLR